MRERLVVRADGGDELRDGLRVDAACSGKYLSDSFVSDPSGLYEVGVAGSDDALADTRRDARVAGDPNTF